LFLSLHRHARTPISEAKDAFFAEIQRFSVETQKYYKRVINDFTLNFPKKYISNYVSADIVLYLNKFAWGRKNSTVNKSLSALKSWFRFLSDTYGITNITSGIRKRKENLPYRPFISKIDLDKILQNATQKQADIIRMLAHTGMRCSELAGLKPENIAPNLSSITIQGKGGKVRTIPCNQTVKEILSRGIKFPKNRKTIYNMCHDAGIRKQNNMFLSPHMLRRLFATNLLNAGVSLLIISRLLGHASVHQTEIYLQIDSSFLSGVTDVLD
jgi:site-specific recombinase XerD